MGTSDFSEADSEHSLHLCYSLCARQTRVVQMDTWGKKRRKEKKKIEDLSASRFKVERQSLRNVLFL